MSKFKFKLKKPFKALCLSIALSLSFASLSYASPQDYLDKWGYTEGTTPESPGYADIMDKLMEAAKKDIRSSYQSLLDDPSNASKVASDYKDMLDAAAKTGWSGLKYDVPFAVAEDKFKKQYGRMSDAEKQAFLSALGTSGLEDFKIAIEANKSDYPGPSSSAGTDLSGDIQYNPSSGGSLSRIPKGSLIAHIYFSKASSATTTNHVTLALNEIDNWAAEMEASAGSDGAKFSYGKQTQPSGRSELTPTSLGYRIQNMYTNQWLVTKDSRSTNNNGLFALVWAKFTDVVKMLEKQSLTMAAMTSTMYTAILDAAGDIFGMAASYSIPSLMGYGPPGQEPNWLQEIFEKAGINKAVLDPVAGIMMVVFMTMGLGMLIWYVRKGLTKQNFNKVRNYSYFIRVMTMIMTPVLAVVLYSFTADIGAALSQNSLDTASSINDEYFVDTLAWAALTNLDNTPVGSTMAASKDSVKALNRVINAKAANMPTSLKQMTGSDLSNSIKLFISGETATVEDYFNVISAANDSATFMNAALVPSGAATVVADGERYNVTTTPMFLSTIGDIDKADLTESMPETPSTTPDDATPADRPTEGIGRTWTIMMDSNEDGPKAVSMTKDAKMTATPFSWNNPSTYIYGAAPVGSISLEQAHHDNFIFGKESRQAFNPETGAKDQFKPNAAAIAYYNLHAGTIDGSYDGPLSTQSTAFLLQSTLANGALNYRGFNTVASTAGEAKNVGKDGVVFLRYTMPAPNEAYVTQASAELNLRWTGALAAAIVAIVAAIKTPLIKGMFNAIKGFFGGLLKGDVISLFQFGLWTLCVASSMIFVQAGISMGVHISDLIINLPFFGTLITGLQKLPIVGALSTFIILYGLIKVLTFKVIKTNGMEVNLVEALVILPYIIVESWTSRMDMWRYMIYGRAGVSKSGVSLSDDLQDKVDAVTGVGTKAKNAGHNLDTAGKLAAGALMGAAGLKAYQAAQGLKNAGEGLLNKNTGSADSNIDAEMTYDDDDKKQKAGDKYSANPFDKESNEEAKENLQSSKEDMYEKDEDGEIIRDENGNAKLKEEFAGDQKLDEDGNPMYDEDGNPIMKAEEEAKENLEEGESIENFKYQKDEDGNYLRDENGNLILTPIPTSEDLNDPEPKTDERTFNDFDEDGNPIDDKDEFNEDQLKDEEEQTEEQEEDQHRDYEEFENTKSQEDSNDGEEAKVKDQDELIDEQIQSDANKYRSNVKYDENGNIIPDHEEMNVEENISDDDRDKSKNRIIESEGKIDDRVKEEKEKLQEEQNEKLQEQADKTVEEVNKEMNEEEIAEQAKSQEELAEAMRDKAIMDEARRRLNPDAEISEEKDLDEKIKSSDEEVNKEFDNISQFNDGSKVGQQANVEDIDEYEELADMTDEQINKILNDEAKIIDDKKDKLHQSTSDSAAIFTGDPDIDSIIRNSMEKSNKTHNFDWNKTIFDSASDEVNEKDKTKKSKSSTESPANAGIISAFYQSAQLTDEQKMKNLKAKNRINSKFSDARDILSGIKSGEIFEEGYGDRIAKGGDEGRKHMEEGFAKLNDAVRIEYLDAFNDKQKEIINNVEQAIQQTVVDKQEARLDAHKDLVAKASEAKNTEQMLDALSQQRANFEMNDPDLQALTRNYQIQRAELAKGIPEGMTTQAIQELDKTYAETKAKTISDMNKKFDSMENDLKANLEKQLEAVDIAQASYSQSNEEFKRAKTYAENYDGSEDQAQLRDALEASRDKFINEYLKHGQYQAAKEIRFRNEQDVNETIRNLKDNKTIQDYASAYSMSGASVSESQWRDEIKKRIQNGAKPEAYASEDRPSQSSQSKSFAEVDPDSAFFGGDTFKERFYVDDESKTVKVKPKNMSNHNSGSFADEKISERQPEEKNKIFREMFEKRLREDHPEPNEEPSRTRTTTRTNARTNTRANKRTSKRRPRRR